MDAQDFWYSSGAAGGGGGDPGDPIGQSLRFRDAQMQRTITNQVTVYSLSFWVKRGALDSERILFQEGGHGIDWRFNTNNQLRYEQTNTSGSTTQVFRDPSAWYHIFYNYTADTDTLNLWVNGESINPNMSNGANSLSGAFIVGHDASADYYMADVYFIDGQTLQPTAFGRTNDNGVWVPREVDFTPTTMRFSDFLTVDSGGFAAADPATDAFDGNEDTWANNQDGGATITLDTSTFNWSGDLVISMRCGAATYRVLVDGTEEIDEVADGDDPTDYTITIDNPDSIVFEPNTAGSGGIYLHTFELDGEMITNPFIWSADLTTNTSFNVAAANVFDGDTSEFCDAIDGGNPTTVTFAPSTTIEGITSLEVWRAGGTGYSATFGGDTTNLNNEDAWNTIDLGTSTELSETSTLVVSRTSGAVAISAIRVNGQVLVDGVNNSYGANGFHLDFADPDDIGNDSSGNGNDFTATGFELADDDDPDYDLMQDSPTQNYATVNPLALDEPGRADIVNANLRVDSTSNGTWSALTTLINQAHFYFEVTMPVDNPSSAGTGTIVGVTRITQYPAEAGWADNSVYWVAQDVLNDFGTSTNNWAGTTYGTEGDVIGVEYDRDNTRVRFWLNGTLEGTVTNAELDDGQFSPLIRHASSTAQSEYVYNFGQQPFVHRPADLDDTNNLQTQNLPEATIANGRDHFGVLTYTGNGDGQTIGTDFVPDLIWFKTRTAANNHLLVDSVRGGDRGLFSNELDAETTSNQYVTDFDDNGSIVTGNATEINDDTQQQVAWYWRAGGAAVANDDGDIESQVSANTAAGFSIVGYPSEGGNRNIGHGLTQAPEFMIVKALDHDIDWAVYHVSTGNTGILKLNEPDAFTTSAGAWNNTTPNNQTFRVGATSFTNGSGDEQGDYIAYCWHSVPGYSAFGSFTGVDDANGVFVSLGFKPAFLLIKQTNASRSWNIWDNSRSPHNPCDVALFPDEDQDENSNMPIDFLSNGFKARKFDFNYNSDNPYIYAAFAENPFQAPVTAR